MQGIVLERKGARRLTVRAGCLHIERSLTLDELVKEMAATTSGRCLVVLDYYGHSDFMDLVSDLVDAGHVESIAILTYDGRRGIFATENYTKLGVRKFGWPNREDAIAWVTGTE